MGTLGLTLPLLAALVVLPPPTAGRLQTPVQPQLKSSQPAKGTGRIRGRVVAADIGAPVRHATVRLSLPGTLGWIGLSDADGRFEFTDLPAGRFRIGAIKAGFLTGNLGGPVGQTINLASGQTMDNLDLRLQRGAVISGRVFDEFGDPIVEAHVQAYRLEYRTGRRRLSGVRGVQTNDLGQFRFYGLTSGKYYVAAALRVDAFGMEQGSGAPVLAVAGRGLAPTFFPGTVQSSEAQPIVVSSAMETGNIDFAMRAVRLAQISGGVVDSQGRPAPNVMVMLNPAKPEGAGSVFDSRMTDVRADGRFTLTNVPPGEYTIDVRSKASLERIAQTGGVGQPQSDDVDEFASVGVSVTGDDVDGMVVTTTRGFRMTGRVLVDGAAATADVLEKIRVSVLAALPGQGVAATVLAATARVRDDGTFEVRGLLGPRIVRVYGLPEGWAFKYARLGATDVTDGGLDLRTGDVSDVEIALTRRPTVVEGVVTDDRGTPRRESAVAIFSDDPRRWIGMMNRYVTSARSDAQGRFKVAALPPGDYLAVALESLVEGEWAEPDNLEKLRADAIRFSLGDGERQTLALVRR